MPSDVCHEFFVQFAYKPNAERELLEPRDSMFQGDHVVANLAKIFGTAVYGVDGKVHFLYQTEDIQNARQEGKLRVNAFVQIEKQFSQEGRPSLHVEDLGDASELLHDNTYFGKAALHLIGQGVTQVERTWGGWLGQYQDAIGKYISMARPRQREGRDRGRAR